MTQVSNLTEVSERMFSNIEFGKFLNKYLKSENVVDNIKTCITSEQLIILITVKNININIKKLTAAFDRLSEIYIDNYIPESATINYTGNILEVVLSIESNNNDLLFACDI